MTDDPTQPPSEHGTDEQDTEEESLRAKVQRLESLVEHQQAIIEELQARRDTDGEDASESAEQETPAEDETTTDEGLSTPVSRRGVLTTGGALGLLGIGAGSTRADPSGQIGTSSNPLKTLYTEELSGGVTDDTSLTNIAGSNLSIDNSGNLNASGGGGGGKWADGTSGSSWLEPSDSGDTKIEGIDTIKNAGGSLTLQASSGSGVTINTDGGTRALDLGVPTDDDDDNTAGANVVAGHADNTVNNSAAGVVIAGGGAAGNGHSVGNDYATVGGGRGNSAVDAGDTVAGGENNTANANDSRGLPATVGGGSGNEAIAINTTVAGGSGNTADGSIATIGGGDGNNASGTYSTIGGGQNNKSNGDYACIPGGEGNTASGSGSFAAGQWAKAEDDKSFVWNDGSGATDATGDSSDKFSSNTNFNSTPAGDNTFSVKATGGVRFVTSGDNTSHAYVDTDGNVVASNNLDAQGGTVENTTGGLTLKQNGTQALKLLDGSSSISPSSDSATPPNVIGGHPSNNTGGYSVEGVTIAGGGGDSGSSNDNEASGNWATVGGGLGNTASAFKATVGGGEGNEASDRGATVAGGSRNKATNSGSTVGGGSGNEAKGGYQPTVAGGLNNTANGDRVTVGGGSSNEASGEHSTVGGGRMCTASGNFSTVPGGHHADATGTKSFAAGSYATASNDGAFVWGDSSDTSVASSANDQVIFQAGGTRNSGTAVEFYSQSDGSAGVSLNANGSGWNQLSSRAAKTDIDPVSGPEVLEEIEQLEVSTWRYEGQDESILHMGPMAEDFHEAFGLGSSEETINTVDADGVALAAIKGLSQKLDDKDERIEGLEAETDDLRAENDQLRERNADLEDRLAAVEAELGIDATASQQGRAAAD